MIQRKLVFCIDNNIKFVRCSIPATKLTANDINRDVIYVVAPFEISSVIKVKFADELNEQDSVSQLLKYTNEVSVDELVEKTKHYYETVKDWNVYYIEMSGKPLSFVSNRISSGIFVSFSVVITKPKTNLVSGLNFMGYEYGESLENHLNNGEYKIIRNPLFEEDGVSYNVDDIIYKENDNYFRVSASIRKGGTGSQKYLVEPNISAIDESLDPTLTEQIIEMVTDLEQDVAHISRNAILKDGSVAMEDDLNLDGNDLVNVNEIKVDTIRANGSSKIEVINDIDISGNDIGNVANITTNSAYTQRVKVDIIESYNNPEINIIADVDMDHSDIKNANYIETDDLDVHNSADIYKANIDKVYVKELHSVGLADIEVVGAIDMVNWDIKNAGTIYVKNIRSNAGNGIIEVLDHVDMNGKGIYGAGEVEGEIGTFNNSLTKGGKEVATIEYVDQEVARTLKPMGNWNASTNTPTLLATDINRANQVWYVNVAGTQFGIEFDVGDELVYNINGEVFRRDNVDAVISVQGKQGVVTLVPSEIGAVEEALNDGKTYARKNKSWVEVASGSSGYEPDEETITLNNNDELEATNVSIWRYAPPKFLFYGGATTQTVVKADLENLSTIDTTVNYGGNILSIATDNAHIYVGGGTIERVRKYLKSDLSYVGETPDYGGLIYSIEIDDTHIYVGGYTTRTIRKYLKSDLSYVGETPSYGGDISAIATDNTYIYVGGSTTNTIRKYLKSDLSYVGETPSYGGGILSIAIDDTHIYVGGGTIERVRKYLKSDLSYVGETPDYGGLIRSIAIDNTHIYVGGWTTNTVKKYLKSDLSYVGETPSYSGTISAIATDNTYIYVGGWTTNTIRKYLKSDLSYIDESPSYGGNISAIVIG